MARAISAVCCLIVGLQILIGVPLVVCVVFFLLANSESVGPIAVEVHAGPNSPHAVAIAPPPNMIPPSPSTSFDNPILTTRAEQGSPLAGTVLSEGMPPSDEQSLFVAALEKVAAESTTHQTPALPASEPAVSVYPTAPREHADRFAIEHLYAMANMDEGVEKYDRADEWRARAREIRRQAAPAESTNAPASDSLSEAFDPARSAH